MRFIIHKYSVCKVVIFYENIHLKKCMNSFMIWVRMYFFRVRISILLCNQTFLIKHNKKENQTTGKPQLQFKSHLIIIMIKYVSIDLYQSPPDPQGPLLILEGSLTFLEIRSFIFWPENCPLLHWCIDYIAKLSTKTGSRKETGVVSLTFVQTSYFPPPFKLTY